MAKKKRRNKIPQRVCIVGKGPGRGLAPRHPLPNMQIWGINNVGLEQYVDMIFDMHDLEWTVADCYRNYWHLKDLVPDEELRQRSELRQHGFTKVLEYCARVNKPLMSVRKYKGVPSSRTYPLQQIIRSTTATFLLQQLLTL